MAEADSLDTTLSISRRTPSTSPWAATAAAWLGRPVLMERVQALQDGQQGQAQEDHLSRLLLLGTPGWPSHGRAYSVAIPLLQRNLRPRCSIGSALQMLSAAITGRLSAGCPFARCCCRALPHCCASELTLLTLQVPRGEGQRPPQDLQVRRHREVRECTQGHQVGAGLPQSLY